MTPVFGNVIVPVVVTPLAIEPIVSVSVFLVASGGAALLTPTTSTISPKLAPSSRKSNLLVQIW